MLSFRSPRYFSNMEDGSRNFGGCTSNVNSKRWNTHRWTFGFTGETQAPARRAVHIGKRKKRVYPFSESPISATGAMATPVSQPSFLTISTDKLASVLCSNCLTDILESLFPSKDPMSTPPSELFSSLQIAPQTNGGPICATKEKSPLKWTRLCFDGSLHESTLPPDAPGFLPLDQLNQWIPPPPPPPPQPIPTLKWSDVSWQSLGHEKEKSRPMSPIPDISMSDPPSLID